MPPGALEAIWAVVGAFMMKAVSEWVPAAVRWLTGKSQREREDLVRAERELRDAKEETDREATIRRRLEEYASLLRRMLIEKGVAYTDPSIAWPSYPKRGTADGE